ncbi:MAG: hypothetical protein LJE65_02365 [Desulfobacteraceae bacterium]|nr:hypothetical protein [Desulfobacteraceae bacterium]
MERPDMEELQKQINDWNAKYPLGTKVKVEGYDEEKVTKTEARILFDQKAVIYLEGHNGYFDLGDCTPVSDAGESES